MTTLTHGDAREVLAAMPAESVHCVITSPPYWGLRSYAAPDVVWGGSEGCQHEWVRHVRPAADGTLTLEGNSALRAGHQGDKSATMKPTVSAFCQRCGAWRGQLGAEPTIEGYVSHLVEVFRAVRRVLRNDGVLFLNLGDSYTSGGRAERDPGQSKIHPAFEGDRYPDGLRPDTPEGLKPKDLCEIPSRVVLALQADGWWLRSRIPWLKQNCMPESTTDRPTNAIEYWFMLTRSARYYWDPEAVRLPVSNGTEERYRYAFKGEGKRKVHADFRHGDGYCTAEAGEMDATRGRNRRNSDWLLESFQGLILDELGGPLVMVVNPQGYDAEYCTAPDCGRYYDGADKKLVRREKYTGDDGKQDERRWCLCGRSDAWLSHYATFPEKAIEPIILAATSERGCCPKCGAPWRRVVKKAKVGDWHPDPEAKRAGVNRNHACEYRGTWSEQDPQSSGRRLLLNTKAARASGRGHDAPFGGSATLGWRPGCDCDAGEPVPCVVADCFAGTSTVGVVAERLGRRAELIEVSPDYVAMSNARLAAARREPVAECDEALPLFAEAR